ncbi:hypothetical protein DFH27DRAFT_601420 [Peziza echinospora]|nr:hypothetical protein DFH27DRAFT_601420 [Peziza echinospora]
MRNFLKSPIKKTPSKRGFKLAESISSSSHTTGHSSSTSTTSSSGLAKLTLTNSTFATTPLLPLLNPEPLKRVPKHHHTYKLFPSQSPDQPRIISPVYGVDVLYRNINSDDYGVILPRLRDEEYKDQTSFNTTPPLMRPCSPLEIIQLQQANVIERAGGVGKWRRCFGNDTDQPQNTNLPGSRVWPVKSPLKNGGNKPHNENISQQGNGNQHLNIINSKSAHRNGIRGGPTSGCLRLRNIDAKYKPPSDARKFNGITPTEVRGHAIEPQSHDQMTDRFILATLELWDHGPSMIMRITRLESVIELFYTRSSFGAGRMYEIQRDQENQYNLYLL